MEDIDGGECRELADALENSQRTAETQASEISYL